MNRLLLLIALPLFAIAVMIALAKEAAANAAH